MERFSARTLMALSITLACLGAAPSPSHAVDGCVWDGSFGDTLVSGVGYVDIDVTSPKWTSICVNTGSVGFYIANNLLEPTGRTLDSDVEVCVFTEGTITSCVNPVTRVNVGIANDDVANTGVHASPSSVWVELLNDPTPTLRVSIDTTHYYQDVPGGCINVVGSSTC